MTLRGQRMKQIGSTWIPCHMSAYFGFLRKVLELFSCKDPSDFNMCLKLWSTASAWQIAGLVLLVRGQPTLIVGSAAPVVQHGDID
eukprot:770974-Amphidinium_carterae.1